MAKKTTFESPIERILFYAMLDKGIVPVYQYPIGKYRVDFAFPEYKLVVEADGKEWHSTKKQKAYDRRRQSYLEKRGWKVIRFTGSEIWKNVDKCVRKIACELKYPF